MMRFDPAGMFARDLKECLAVQLAEKNRLDPAMAALLDNLDLLARRDLKRLMAVCGVDAADLADMIAEIRRLDPKPGAAFDASRRSRVIPDVLMRAAARGRLGAGTQPRNHAAGAGQPELLRPGADRARAGRTAPFWRKSCRPRTGWSSRCSSGRRPS